MMRVKHMWAFNAGFMSHRQTNCLSAIGLKNMNSTNIAVRAQMEWS